MLASLPAPHCHFRSRIFSLHHMQFDYPADRRCRLFVRRAQSLLQLCRISEAHRDFSNAQRCLTADSIAYPERLHGLIAAGLKRCEDLSRSLSPAATTPALLLFRSGLAGSAHDNHRNGNGTFQLSPVTDYSSNFEVTFGGEQFGWQLVSTRAFKPGEMILLDKPYSRRLRRDRLLTHCSQCFRRSLNLLPCRACSEVGFCSPSCESVAWNTPWDASSPVHRFECGQVHRLCISDYAGWKWYRSKSHSVGENEQRKLFRAFLQSLSLDACVGGENISWLAFACVADTAPHLLISLIQDSFCSGLQSHDRPIPSATLLAFSGRRSYPVSRLADNHFSSIGWLATNSDRRTAYDLWQRTVAAVFLTHCLSAGGYPLDWDTYCFCDPKGDCLPVDAKLPASWAAALLLHLIQAISSNAHTFTTTVYENFQATHRDTSESSDNASRGIDLHSLTSCEVGSCLYPVLSLLNHSCNPNVVQVYMDDGACGLFALHSIKRGHLLYGNYGYHYATHLKSKRCHELREQYLFDCTCEACSGDWPKQSLEDKVFCQHCSYMVAGFSGEQPTCTCSPKVQRRTLDLYTSLIQKFREDIFTIPSVYVGYRFQDLPVSLVEKHVDRLSRMLDVSGLERVLRRPSMPYEYSQELLKLLLDIRYGSLEIFSSHAKGCVSCIS